MKKELILCFNNLLFLNIGELIAKNKNSRNNVFITDKFPDLNSESATDLFYKNNKPSEYIIVFESFYVIEDTIRTRKFLDLFSDYSIKVYVLATSQLEYIHHQLIQKAFSNESYSLDAYLQSDKFLQYDHLFEKINTVFNKESVQVRLVNPQNATSIFNELFQKYNINITQQLVNEQGKYLKYFQYLVNYIKSKDISISNQILERISQIAQATHTHSLKEIFTLLSPFSQDYIDKLYNENNEKAIKLHPSFKDIIDVKFEFTYLNNLEPISFSESEWQDFISVLLNAISISKEGKFSERQQKKFLARQEKRSNRRKQE